jgi:hypothetical protein
MGKETNAINCLKSQIFFHFTANTYFHGQHLQLKTQMFSNRLVLRTVIILHKALTYILQQQTWQKDKQQHTAALQN